MKKLDNINSVTFNDDKLYFDGVPVEIGTDIDKWYENYSNLELILKPSEYDIRRRYNYFSKIDSLELCIFDGILDRITIYPYQFQSSPYFKGDIYIFDKKLELPFKSDDIEQYFPSIIVDPKGYFNRFKPRESISYPVSNTVKIEISIGRDPALVGSLSLKAI
ncbi:hypothetical protein DHW03_02205 [Pedobacter yonginense]|uniref:Uncharacterized protein n=1 Tax=Pedobacter yonginense TaxID=651869 RepID=A0A317EPA8_9SPHI|nr:hypothetical protein [Pedobacter yonginense]PWS28681.1 hypothetical protein DHW03_02205 [Pedobacter yonginense]